MEDGVVTIACKNGRIFSACVEREAKGNEWFAQVGYYAQQGCVIEIVPTDKSWSFGPDCGCDHCKTLKHDVEAYEYSEDEDDEDDEDDDYDAMGRYIFDDDNDEESDDN